MINKLVNISPFTNMLIFIIMYYHVLDEKPYALEDDSFDTKFGCDIRKTLNRKGREKLFEVRLVLNNIKL